MDRAEPLLHVEVVYSPAPSRVEQRQLLVAADSTVADVIVLSGLVGAMPTHVGIWGKPCLASDLVADGDRIELYRPLVMDPMEARRRRQRVQQRSGRALVAKNKTPKC